MEALRREGDLMELLEEIKSKYDELMQRKEEVDHVHNFGIFFVQTCGKHCLELRFCLVSEILTNVNLQCISRRATNYKLLVYHLELTPRDITDAQKLNSSYGENSDISLTLLEVY